MKISTVRNSSISSDCTAAGDPWKKKSFFVPILLDLSKKNVTQQNSQENAETQANYMPTRKKNGT